MAILDKLLRTGEGQKLKALEGLVPHIGVLEPEMQALSDEELQARTPALRERLANGADLNDLLAEAFAVMREASWRVIGQRHYDVQLMGGAALHLGWVAEMRTGEGKTLVSTLPVYLNGLTGEGVHVVTVNDYLASRDADWMGQIHRWLGLSVGLVIPGVRDQDFKRQQYACDITYGTNNEFGFDYLRDNMALSAAERTQRGHRYCIVDEIDSILIDEARTPLIISGQVAEAANTYYRFASIVRRLVRDEHYEVDEEKRTVAPTEDGVGAVEQALGVENLYDSVQVSYVHHLGAALRAKELYRRDKEYILNDGEVKIVDEFTGRILDGRRWSDGLHQAIEAKEGVKIQEENQTLATITLQNYFRLYEKLAGMTGTAQTEASELHGTYDLQVVSIPTHMPMVRADQPDLVYRTEEAKYDAIVDDIAERVERGQPVLVGTISVEKSETLSGHLTRRGVPHEVLNAKQHAREAEIIAQAGRLGRVTVATNMAGRGVDIILGGNPESMARRDLLADGYDPQSKAYAKAYPRLLESHTTQCATEGGLIKELGGLYVVGTERHESRRIDNQLRGRSGRQGDPGESRFYLSLEDDLMRIFATGAMNWVMSRSMDDTVPIESKMVTKSVERAQTTVEQRNAETRKNVLRYDEVMNNQRRVIYKLRGQILEGAELRDRALEHLREEVEAIAADLPEEEPWDYRSILVTAGNLWPTDLTPEDLAAEKTPEGLTGRLLDDVTALYARREAEIGTEVMRGLERQVMLRVIDQHWRTHLYEMDYLKEGIHLRAAGQKDPLSEWQREGFEMFGDLMQRIRRDFVRMITHIQVVKPETEQVSATRNVTYSGPTDPSEAPSALAQAAAAAAGVPLAGAKPAAAPSTAGKPAAGTATLVRSAAEKTGRNAPCPCGSGKKYKLCCGR
ncbi:MAG: preprotein translocase subunit SecA [Acidimicrobiia bacterium]|nr:preprotein translocase subunit SecA [Acidimicrobiia bacterium]